MSFRDLHYADEPLLLPNAWDVSSALAFLRTPGIRAIGTTSFGVAASAGHPDGGRSSKEPTSRLVRQLRTLPAYVSADCRGRLPRLIPTWWPGMYLILMWPASTSRTARTRN